MFDNIKADLDRLSTNGEVTLRQFIAGVVSPGFQAVLCYRFFNWCHQRGIPTQPVRYCVERLVEVTTGVSIPACCTIGKGLRIFHFGGIILHPTVELGENCTIYHEVTIGERGDGKAAKIGNNVLIGAGAKVIGRLSIGDFCVVGANAVVTKDMPRGYVAIGNPATLKLRKS
jgi:serine O-acetyltransferase